MYQFRTHVCFMQDHMERCSGHHIGHTLDLVADGEYYCIVHCDDAALVEILSDARHYASGAVDLAGRGLIAAAAMTVKEIEKLRLANPKAGVIDPGQVHACLLAGLALLDHYIRGDFNAGMSATQKQMFDAILTNSGKLQEPAPSQIGQFSEMLNTIEMVNVLRRYLTN